MSDRVFFFAKTYSGRLFKQRIAVNVYTWYEPEETLFAVKKDKPTQRPVRCVWEKSKLFFLLQVKL